MLGWTLVGLPRGRGAAARRSDSRARLHRALLGGRARRADDSRRQLRTASRVVSVSARLAAAGVLPAQRASGDASADRFGVLGGGDHGRVRHPLAIELPWRRSGVDRCVCRPGRSVASRSLPASSRRRSSCTSAICTSGGICRWSCDATARGAAPSAGRARAVARAGRRRSRRRRRDCARRAPRGGAPEAVVLLGSVQRRPAARAVPRRGRVSSIRRSTKASVCRSSKRWRAARRSSRRARRRFRRSSATPACSSIPVTCRRWRDAIVASLTDESLRDGSRGCADCARAASSRGRGPRRLTLDVYREARVVSA